jgi:IS5 family transposase
MRAEPAGQAEPIHVELRRGALHLSVRWPVSAAGGRRALEIIESHGYIPHVVSRGKESQAKRRNPAKKARRWVVKVCHSWFNRFRKLLVQYEKLDRSFIALNYLAAAIIAFRKVPLTVNIIHG